MALVTKANPSAMFRCPRQDKQLNPMAGQSSQGESIEDELQPGQFMTEQHTGISFMEPVNGEAFGDGEAGAAAKENTYSNFL